MQNQKIKMSQKKFRIGELAEELKVKKFVIRFWEKEFDFASDRSEGGQRFYTPEDLTIFMAIKDLLYNQGYTIAGAKTQLTKVLKEKHPTLETSVALSYGTAESENMITPAHHEVLIPQELMSSEKLSEQTLGHIQKIREKLLELKERLT